ncbi:hypothetical protein [Geodermatophilus nigrescens]|uniref:Uncharacterized protein n=1 Tax=Geodermatophilus nigrescens TaxID=1070870 RepID=A0A1M5EXR7_9ACTN|nr:hypothetical protein [Geodermatophilus nigrescens]SHF84029.1 hypothetical protein SAMN05444351_0985 [Geodermatophilus nigrescens]
MPVTGTLHGPGDEAGRRAGPRTEHLLFAVLTVAWLVATAWHGLQWLGEVVDHAVPDWTIGGGERPTGWAERSEAQRHARLATVWGTVLPWIGLAVALVRRRGLSATVFGGGVLLCLVLGLGMHDAVTPDPPEPEPPRGCVEWSGYPSDCP